MKYNVKAHLHDIYEACQSILSFTTAMSQEDYEANALVKAAVERKFTVMGEVLFRLRREYPAILDQISASEQVIGFRDLLLHDYHMIENAAVWLAIKDSLPTLMTEVKFLLGND